MSDTQSDNYEIGTFRVKRGLADMLRGGVIMDVVNAEEAKIAEDAGATAVMALERVPSDIRRDGGVARMSDPVMIEDIQKTVTIPVMAKARIGHFAEAQILQSLGVDYVDESEVLTPADEAHHIDKWAFTVPFVCGATNLGEALRRISEGACMIRSKGEAGTGNIVEAVRHLRSILGDIRKITQADAAELFQWAKTLQAPLGLVQEIRDELLKSKVEQAFVKNLEVIFCCGESLVQREIGMHFNWIKSQISDSLFHLSATEFQNIVIAYEPIWAIGTGVTASTAQAQEIHAFIRNLLTEKYGNNIAESISILYGGSCKPSNAKELFASKDIDGGLIGGASLESDDFISIINSFNK